MFSFDQINAAGKSDQSFYNVLDDFNTCKYSIYPKTGKVIFNESSIKQKFYCIPYYLGMRKILPGQMNEQVEYENKWHERLERNVIENPVFFMFSDDIEWVKNNIHTECVTYYEDGTDPVWEKLRLMSACKHFIVSNSTFSWWTQYLSANENKVVVSPSRWFNEHAHEGKRTHGKQ